MAERFLQTKAWLTSNGKVVSLLLTMLVGFTLPQAYVLTFLVQYLLMLMLFFSFFELKIDSSSIKPQVIKILAANLILGFAWYFLFLAFDRELAFTAFITAIAPSAITSTVVIGFIRGKVDFMIATVLITNIAVALVIPFTLPHMVGTDIKITTWGVLFPVLVTMFVPLILARLTVFLPTKVTTVIRSGKKYTFGIWLLNLFIISSKASHFIFTEKSATVTDLVQIAALSLVICIVNFILGAVIGGRDYWQESSQALGQKNNSFAIWIAVTFINPLAAMGPTIYILYHHLYNTWQIYRFEKKQKENLWKKQISA